MYLLFVVIVWIIFGVKFVEWKDWKSYYPTILYYCVINLFYDFLYYNHSLWEFVAVTTDYLNHTIISIVFFFTVIPISILIFLQRYPKKRTRQWLYIFIWAFFYWIIEYVFAARGLFIYKNGWNIWHSLWFDIAMFGFFRLHYIKPVLTLFLTIITIIIFMWLFPVPLSVLK